MTLFIIYTILMTVLSVINGIFTYKIFKQLEMGINMGKNKKASFGMSKRDADKLHDGIFGGVPSIKEEKCDESVVKEEFDGSFSNPFADRELDYLIRQSSPKTVEGLLETVAASHSNNVTDASNSAGGNSVNIPIITDEYDFPEDDERMLNRLLFLSDYLNGKYKPLDASDQEFEDMKWETINETYCLITVDLPRKKAEVVRKYFRRLDTTYAKQDGTYYSKVSKGELAKEVIDDLIEVYPWYEIDKTKVKVNWGGFRKSNTNVIKLNPEEGSDDHVYMDRLKYAIGNLGKSVEKLNEILSGK